MTTDYNEDANCPEGMDCRFSWLKVGEIDSSGRRVEQIVYVERGQYVIYFVEKDYLRAYYIDDYAFSANFSNEFQQALSEVRSYTVKNIKKNEFIRQDIASAYFNALSGYEDIAISELKTLGQKLMYRNYVYWISAYMGLCMMFIVGCISLFFTSQESMLNEMVYCITSSCVGSLLIYSKKQGKTMTSHYLPTIDAIITFLSSCISGFLVFAILKSNLLLGTFNKSVFGMMLVSFIAGYSEDIPLKLLSGISDLMMAQKNKS